MTTWWPGLPAECDTEIIYDLEEIKKWYSPYIHTVDSLWCETHKYLTSTKLYSCQHAHVQDSRMQQVELYCFHETAWKECEERIWNALRFCCIQMLNFVVFYIGMIYWESTPMERIIILPAKEWRVLLWASATLQGAEMSYVYGCARCLSGKHFYCISNFMAAMNM